VYSTHQDQLESALGKAIRGMDLSLVFKYLQTPEISEQDQKTISHMVVQYGIMGKEYRKCELDFASGEIAHRVVEAKVDMRH